MAVIIPFSATPRFTWERGDPCVFSMLLLGDVTSSVFDTAGVPMGAHFKFIIIQDATGNRAFTWPTICKLPPPVGFTAGQTTVQQFIFDGIYLVPSGLPAYF
jgi:hypothetical protein